MRKFYFLIGYIIISLCLFGCNTPINPSEADLNDKQSGDIIEDENPVNSDEGQDIDEIPDSIVVVPSEKDKLADLYVRDLYDNFIVTGDRVTYTGLFHTEEVFFSEFDMEKIKNLAYFIDYNKLVYPDNYWLCCYDLNDMQNTVERYLSSDIEVDTAEWAGGGLYFTYDKNMNRFCGDAAAGDDYAVNKIFDFFGKYEINGEYLYIYDRVLFCTHDRFNTGIIKFYSDINKTEESFVNEMQVGEFLPSDFSNDDALEQYGAEYKHTFKLSEDGSNYYWVSSEPAE